MNAALDAVGISAPMNWTATDHIVGDGMENLVRRTLPDSGEKRSPAGLRVP